MRSSFVNLTQDHKHGKVRSPFAWLSAIVLPLMACHSRPSDLHKVWDSPETLPEAVGELASVDSVAAKAAPDPADCGRGTGRNRDGECQRLELWETETGERVLIPSGEFAMGSGFVEAFDFADQRLTPAVSGGGTPPHYADVASFWIDLTEVSRTHYEACVDAEKCTPALCEGEPPGNGPLEFPENEHGDLPQTCVSHEQAGWYCEFRGGRLPTEAEWEYAASGPASGTYPWGDNFRDDVPGGIMPAGRITRMDGSYFGILGMGSSAHEWVAETFDPDGALLAYGPSFRRADGPLNLARVGALGHVVKHVERGKRRESQGPAQDIGFRCAANLRSRDPQLRAPAESKAFSLTRMESGFELFPGVAESVDRQEAEAFCTGLRVAGARDEVGGWHLPTADDVVAVSASFRGPGPFWTEDGAIVQQDPSDPESIWTTLEVADDESLAARCLRALP